ncbi:MAG: SMC-Scp complex subunit ScpB [Pseudomonadota bacterium]
MTASPKPAPDFDALDAHGVQEALREQIEDGSHELIDAMDDASSQNETETANREETAATPEISRTGEATTDDPAKEEDAEDGEGDGQGDDDGAVSDAPIAVWTAAQMADHVRMVEALLFAAVEPLDEASIAERLPTGADIPALLEALRAQYENRGVILSKVKNKWRFVTAPDVAHVLERQRIEPRKLSRAALETLAIIAYHQPCTRADIEDVRGVAVSRGSLDQLMEIGWVRLRGRRKEVPGRPVLYGTTQTFLEHFGLEGLGDLPGMADLRAAGLLDARLPPNFSIPTPRDGGDADGADEADAGDEAQGPEFAQDFHAPEALTTDPDDPAAFDLDEDPA